MIRIAVVIAFLAALTSGAVFLLSSHQGANILGLSSEKVFEGYFTRENASRCTKSAGRICYALFSPKGKLVTYVSQQDLRKKDTAPLFGRFVKITGTKQVYKGTNYVIASKIEPAPGKVGSEKDQGTKVSIGLAGYVSPSTVSTEGTDAGYMRRGTSIMWAKVEPHMAENPQDYDFTAFAGSDKQIEDCNKLGVPCDFLFIGAPSWAVTKSIQSIKDKVNQNYYCDRGPYDMDPNDPHDVAVMEHYKTFLKMVFERYNGKTPVVIDPGTPTERTVTLIADNFIPNNEPDWYEVNCGQSPWHTGTDLNKNGKPDFEDFGEVTKIFYRVAKAADHPSIQTSFGNLGNFDIHNMRYVKVLNKDDTKTFFYKVLKYIKDTTPENEKNLYPYFDSVSLHAYMLYHCNAPFPDAEKDYYFDKNTLSNYSVGGIRGSVMWVNRVMKSLGFSRPIWLGEIGAATAYAEGSYPEHVMGLNAFKMIVQTLAAPNVTAVKWYDLGFGDPQYGLLDRTTTGPDGTARKRPAYHSYHNLVTELDGYWYRFLDKSNPKNIEGYVFTPSPDVTENDLLASGTSYKEVLWAVPDRPTFCPVPNYDPNNPYSSWAWANDTKVAPNVNKKFVATSITTLDPYGATQSIVDGGPGDLDNRKNGQVMIQLKSIKFNDPNVPEAQKNHPMTPAIPLLVTVTN